jgi:hypothetical protein
MILTYRAPGHCNIGARATIPVMTAQELGACMSRHGMGLGLGTIPALRTRNTKTGQADGSEGRVWRDPNLSPPQEKITLWCRVTWPTAVGISPSIGATLRSPFFVRMMWLLVEG